jgi:hypothetical protein
VLLRRTRGMTIHDREGQVCSLLRIERGDAVQNEVSNGSAPLHLAPEFTGPASGHENGFGRELGPLAHGYGLLGTDADSSAL